MQDQSDGAPEDRRIRSFVRRQGRVTPAQRDALETLADTYLLANGDWTIDFAETFGRIAPTSLEIGFGAGHSLIHRAGQRADWNHIGVEVYRSGVGRAMAEADRSELSNVRMICRDAVEVLESQIARESLSEIVIEFPDPWHKKRHHKRRLVQPAFVTLATSRLQSGGRLLLATDWQNYAEQMLTVLSEHPLLQNVSPEGSFVPRPDTRPTTRFEARGQRLGHQIFDLAFVKTDC